MTAEREHRLYSPSQAEGFFVCRGRQRAQARAPQEPESPYALEGTQAHEVLQAALENGVWDARTAHLEYSSLFMYDLDNKRNEFYLSIDTALNHIKSILDENPDATMWVETFVNPPVDSMPGEAGGYCDVAILLPSLKKLIVIDYKHGAGISKDAVGNKQMLQYAAGFLYDENSPLGSADVDEVEIVIIQPRAFHALGPIRNDYVTPFEVWEHLQELDAVIAECEAPDAALTASKEACQFCGARFTCPARELAALQVANASFKQIEDVRSNLLPDPASLDARRLGLIRFHAPMLRKWLSDCEEHAAVQAKRGVAIPGAKLVESQERRQWYGDEAELAQKLHLLLGQDTDVSSLYELKLIPLTTAEKMVVEAYKKRVGKGRKKQAAEEAKRAFALLTLKQSSGNVVLVDEDDPRPAISRNSFAGIQGLIAPPATSSP